MHTSAFCSICHLPPISIILSCFPF
jgi:hypothetical protein